MATADSVSVDRSPSIAFAALSLAAGNALEAWDRARFAYIRDPADFTIRQAERSAYGHYRDCVEALVAYVVRPLDPPERVPLPTLPPADHVAITLEGDTARESVTTLALDRESYGVRRAAATSRELSKC